MYRVYIYIYIYIYIYYHERVIYLKFIKEIVPKD